MREYAASASSFTILFVGTGNICRSAMAERLGRAYLDDALGEEARGVRLTSVGTRAVVGSSMHPYSAQVLRGLGGDPKGFRARQLRADQARRADLVLTMTQGHRRAVLELVPGALARTFMLREAASLLTQLGHAIHVPGTDLAQRGRALVSAMIPVQSRRHDSEDEDILDPVGLSLRTHQAVGESVADSLVPLLARLTSPSGNPSNRRRGTSPQRVPGARFDGRPSRASSTEGAPGARHELGDW